MSTTMFAPMTRRSFAAGLAAAALLGARDGSAQEAEQYTFAVLGTDKRTAADPEHSDVMMVSRVNMATGTVRTLSIPRDLYVEIPGVGWDKINAAFSRAVGVNPPASWDVGAAATVETIEHNFGLAIDGVAYTTMSDLPKVVDAVGGVTVNNPYEIKTVFSVTYPAGEITLDGKNAIQFCRERKADSDGGRVARQHLVLQGILAKLQDPAMLPRIPELITTLSEAVRTDIPADVQAKLTALIPELSSEDLAFTNIESELWPGHSPGGAWIYEGDWSTLPGYVQGWLDGPQG